MTDLNWTVSRRGSRRRDCVAVRCCFVATKTVLIQKIQAVGCRPRLGRLLGRRTHLCKRPHRRSDRLRGEKIWPTAVEEVLRIAEGKEVAVVGRPDPQWGERVVAFVVLNDTSTTISLENSATLYGHPWSVSAPRELVLLDELPRTAIARCNATRSPSRITSAGESSRRRDQSVPSPTRDNPVDWYPFGDEAFALAKATDRPLSHFDWLQRLSLVPCHGTRVLRRRDTAAIINEHFVAIKVDREEPRRDAIYMEAVSALTGHGGWPLNVFTDERVNHFRGTYFPQRVATVCRHSKRAHRNP